MRTLTELGEAAKKAERILSVASKEKRNEALCAIAKGLIEDSKTIVEANALDLKFGRENGLTAALLDRLKLDEKRIEGIANSVLDVVNLPDPLMRVLSENTLKNGLVIKKVSVPIGVVAVIFEARPNVTADSAALCIKSGNTVILRGGKEAINSNKAIAASMRKALKSVSLPEDCICLVEDTTRESAKGLMCLNGYVDVLIPRGGKGLIESVVKNSTVPVIETGAGTCHTYVDKSADTDMATKIIFKAKVQRPSVCNACECMLVHKDIAEKALPKIAKELLDANVEIRGDEKVCEIIRQANPACDDDWGREYNDYIIAARVVDDIDCAIEHIYRYGTMHSECIVTNDKEAAQYFMNNVDAAAVYVNASTRFTDGGEFGLGAEIGISTQKLHARGPLGLNELTSMKYLVYGEGQVRG